MNEFYIDFQGYCVVQARDREEAENIFFEDIYPSVDSRTYNEVYEVTGIEKVEREGK